MLFEQFQDININPYIVNEKMTYLQHKKSFRHKEIPIIIRASIMTSTFLRKAVYLNRSTQFYSFFNHVTTYIRNNRIKLISMTTFIAFTNILLFVG